MRFKWGNPSNNEAGKGPQATVISASVFVLRIKSNNPVDKTASPKRVDVIKRTFMTESLTGMTLNSKPYFVKLNNRGLLQIEGKDRVSFLQNLISNDLELLNSQTAIYACLLTPQGKFLHDFFVLKGNDVLLIDCEGGARAQDLYQRLNLYKLRSKINISVEDTHPVYAVYNHKTDTSFSDPRHEGLQNRSFTKPENIEELAFDVWDEQRIKLCIPDGSRDMEVEKSTLLECRIDQLNGISFDKGCYIGQELTARMHHRGLAKKHLYAIQGENLPVSGDQIKVDDHFIGEMRSTCANIGLALLKDASIEALSKIGIHPLS